jgi:hypothetical protein
MKKQQQQQQQQHHHHHHHQQQQQQQRSMARCRTRYRAVHTAGRTSLRGCGAGSQRIINS